MQSELPDMPLFPRETPQRHSRQVGQNPVTLSGLLNAIDGNASQEGNTTFMPYFNLLKVLWVAS